MATTFSGEPTPPTSFKLQQSSPLDTLVRRTSKRSRATAQSQAQQYSARPVEQHTPTHALHDEEDVDPYGGYIQEPRLTPPRRPIQQHPPNSPLLHSHFARDSTTTASINGSYLDMRASVGSGNVYQELEYRYHDNESVYSQQDHPSPALRDSWNSATSSGTIHPYDPGSSVPLKPPQTQTEFQLRASAEPSNAVHWAPPVPTLVVSSPDIDNNGNRAGRTPIVRPITSNFSRPVRPSSPSVTAPLAPLLPPASEEQKRRVLDRNVIHPASQSPPQQSFHQNMNRHYQRPTSPSSNPQAVQDRQMWHPASPTSPLPNPYAESVATSTLPVNKWDKSSPMNNYLGSSSNNNDPRNRTPSPQPMDQYFRQKSSQPQSLPQSYEDQKSRPSLALPVALPRQPPSRSDSPASLYSSYSYYNYESPAPSPVGGAFSPQPSKDTPVPQSRHLEPNHSQSNLRSKSPGSRSATPTVTTPQAPQDFLQLGIQHHEANRLKESAIYFERSAKENGGCGVGMLMWGLTLRHGWGCEKNEKSGFKWLRKAAEHAVVDLESARDGADTGSVQDELVLAIYEVGQCFFHGWGVPKDQKMAVSYYTVAARLGDPDAQNDLAFCLANGKGCKKDRKEAAKWYRAAVAQGLSDVGLAWIYKEKLM